MRLSGVGGVTGDAGAGQASDFSGNTSEQEWMKPNSISSKGSRPNSMNLMHARDQPATSVSNATPLTAVTPVALGNKRLAALASQESQLIDRIWLEVEQLAASLDSVFLRSSDVPWLRKVLLGVSVAG